MTFPEAVRRGLSRIARPGFPAGVVFELRYDADPHPLRPSGKVVRLEDGEEVGDSSFIAGKKLFVVGALDKRELRNAIDFVEVRDDEGYPCPDVSPLFTPASGPGGRFFA